MSVEFSVVVALWKAHQFSLAVQVHELGRALKLKEQASPEFEPVTLNVDADGFPVIVDVASDVSAYERPQFL